MGKKSGNNKEVVGAEQGAEKDAEVAAAGRKEAEAKRQKKRKTRWGAELTPASTVPSAEVGAAVTSSTGAAEASAAPPQPPTIVVPDTTPAPPGVIEIKEELPGTPAFNVSEAANAAREALEKAKKAAAFQKQIQQQLQALEAQGQSTIGSVSAQTLLSVSGGVMTIPRPLRLDQYGRELDAEGKVVPFQARVPTTLKVNKKKTPEDTAAKTTEKKKAEPEEPKQSWFDPTLPTKQKKRKGLQFVEAGTFVRKEKQMRRYAEAKSLGIDVSKLRSERIALLDKEDKRGQAALKERQAEEGGNEASQFNPNLIPLGDVQKFSTPIETFEGDVPDIEWWDKVFVRPVTSGVDSSDPGKQDFKINYGRINNLVEHPPPLKRVEAVKAPTAPAVYLTLKERKRLRRRKRQDREREKQDKIRMGLMAPPPPKVKLSNLMKALKDTAVADPSKVEAQVRKQMEDRIKAHEARNEARRLAPEQRKVKNVEKWKQNKEGVVCASAFSVKHLADRRHLFKVDMNAQQYHLTGVCVICPDVATVVVVEGAKRSIKRFKKLMMNRIKWGENETMEDMEQEVDSDAEEPDDSKDQFCKLLWEGVVQSHAFNNWKVVTVKIESDARKVFKSAKVEHYWDMVKRYRDSRQDL